MALFDPVDNEFIGTNETELRNISLNCTDECTAVFIALVTQFYNGDITADEFELQAENEIKDEITRQYVLGIGGQSQMTEAELIIVASILATQLVFLRNMVQRIQDGTYGTLLQAQNWARGYILSARQAFERANTRRNQRKGGCPDIGDVILPAYPGDSSTPCLSYCRCYWSHEFDSNGCWIGASWRLNDAQHCSVCPVRAVEWSPLIMVRYEVASNGQVIAIRV